MELDIKLSQDEYEAAIIAKISSVFPVAPGHEMTLVNTTVGRSNTGLTATIQVLPKGIKPVQRDVAPNATTATATTTTTRGSVDSGSTGAGSTGTPSTPVEAPVKAAVTEEAVKVEETAAVVEETNDQPVSDTVVTETPVETPTVAQDSTEDAPPAKPATNSLFGNLKRS